MKSLVVPASLSTIARSFPTIQLKRELFPTLGGPTKTTFIISLNMSHLSEISKRDFISFADFSNSLITFSVCSEPISSSGKSINASIIACCSIHLD